MNRERAKRLIELADIDEYTLAVTNFPTLLLLLAQEVAELSQEWEGIALSRASADIERRGVICAATYDLCLHAVTEARELLSITKGTARSLPGISHDVYMGPSGDNPATPLRPEPLRLSDEPIGQPDNAGPYVPPTPDELDNDEYPRLDPEGDIG